MKQTIPPGVITQVIDKPGFAVHQDSDADAWIEVQADGSLTFGPIPGVWQAYQNSDAATRALAELLDGRQREARAHLTQLNYEQLDAVDAAARLLSGLAFAVAEDRRINERKST